MPAWIRKFGWAENGRDEFEVAEHSVVVHFLSFGTRDLDVSTENTPVDMGHKNKALDLRAV